jgi:multicomponent Na+:H+ antiporter subunit G
MTVTDLAVSLLIGLGVVLILLAGIGVLRFPDVLTRANAATKATGLGLAAVLAGAAIQIGTPRAYVTLGAAVLVQFATAPVSGHVIGRAAYRSGAPLWSGTHTDDLREFYRTHPRHAKRVTPRD